MPSILLLGCSINIIHFHLLAIVVNIRIFRFCRLSALYQSVTDAPISSPTPSHSQSPPPLSLPLPPPMCAFVFVTIPAFRFCTLLRLAFRFSLLAGNIGIAAGRYCGLGPLREIHGPREVSRRGTMKDYLFLLHASAVLLSVTVAMVRVGSADKYGGPLTLVLRT